jgi:hypothetical protein
VLKTELQSLQSELNNSAIDADEVLAVTEDLRIAVERSQVAQEKLKV